MTNLRISSTLSSPLPKGPYAKIKEDILGKRYELSLTFIGEKRAKKLNQTYRNKDYIPNVLSFPLSESVGDVFICPNVASKEAKNFSLSHTDYLLFLFIHGCLHLKGHDHGDTMDVLEQKYLKKYRTK